MWRSRRGLSVIVAALLCSAVGCWAQVVDPSTMNGKIICGYQGWFACPGDGNDESVGWRHWSRQSDDIGPGLYWTDMWPDVTEYAAEDLFPVPNTTLTNGATPYLFSSARQGVTDVHFRWMQEYSVDGVFLQRFTVGIGTNQNEDTCRARNKVMANVQASAARYGRVWAIGYDVTGDLGTSTFYERITGDWECLKSAFGLYSDPRYLRHNGKPVVVIFGMGIDGSPYPIDAALATQIINYFKNEGCWIIGGVPWGWRTLTGGSKSDAAWAGVYRTFNGIMPWTVGAYGDWNGIQNTRNGIWTPDLAECNSLGMSYHPTAWPRFKWDNMHQFECSAGISPRGGQHFWDQIYAMRQAGAQAIFGAMFDEYDESTAMMKMSDAVPTSGCWWTNEGKPNDWHLRLLNQAAKMLRGEIALSQTIPINASSSPDGAQMVSNTIPTTMHAGRVYNVAVTVRNTGETCWNAEMFKLGAVGDSDPFSTSTRVVVSPGSAAVPNQQWTFRFPLAAPITTGSYTTDWRMVHELIRWFGGTVSKSVTVTSAADVTAPLPLVSFSAAVGDTRAILSWQAPTTADYSGVMIRCKTTGYPSSVSDGTLVVDKPGLPGLPGSHSHAGLTNGVTYYYSAFAHDSVGNYSGRLQASCTPANVESPGLVAQFAVTPGANRNTLSWTNPTAADFLGTMIRYRTDGYPTTRTDGALLCDRTAAPGSIDSFIHTGLINGTSYYYSAFAYDNVPNYSDGAMAVGTPLGQRIPADVSLFDQGPDGWSFTTWRSGPYLDGTIAWSSISGRAGGASLGGIRCTGSGDSDWEDRCTREGGVMTRAISTAGYSNIQISYDLRVSSLGLSYTGSGMGDCPVDNGLIDEQLTVSYSTDGGATWKYADYLDRAELLGCQTYTTRTIDLSGKSACNNNPGFMLRFRWQLNTQSDWADLDNVVVTGNETGPPDTTAPGPVNGLTVIPGNQRNNLVWLPYASWDQAGTKVLAKPDGYPAHLADGLVVHDGPGTSCVHSGLANGTTYYYSVFAYDEIPNYAAPATASGTPAYTDPSVARSAVDNAEVTITTGVVTAVFGDKFYVQCPDKPIAIRVDKAGHGLSVGQAVGFRGVVLTDASNGERYVAATWAQAHGSGAVSPIAIGGRAVGPVPLNNLGLLVKVWGRVTQRNFGGAGHYYVDDGHGLRDGTQTAGVDNVGVRVNGDPSGIVPGSYVVVTGISSCFRDAAGDVERLILPRPGGFVRVWP